MSLHTFAPTFVLTQLDLGPNTIETLESLKELVRSILIVKWDEIAASNW
jgi:hypothetical protein